jgi:nucleotide-binding universal stress UspA family protein
MSERIIVPLDGSSTAEIALPYAIELARNLRAEIVLVSVVEPGFGDSDHLYTAYLQSMAGQVQGQLGELKAGEKTEIQSRVLQGRPADEILRLAEEMKVSLIVMASRGRSTHGSWNLGNIAAKVLRASARPVMLIKAGAKAVPSQQPVCFKRILLPLDGSMAGQQAIPLAKSIAAASDAELVLFQAVEAIQAIYSESYGSATAANIMREESERRKALAMDYLASVEKQLKQAQLRTSKLVVIGSPADQILDYAEKNGVDLIAMSTHGRSGIGRWVFGSVTDKILHAGGTAVLAVRAARLMTNVTL